MHDIFRRFAHRVSEFVGSPWMFVFALLVIVIWGLAGPAFAYSDTWQLVINTGTTIVTFLMVFLIQNTQNRDSRAVHLKLDELLRAVGRARTELSETEHMDEGQLDLLEQEFRALAEKVAKQRKEYQERHRTGSS
jgi:low affinity Fe/Cu permease